MQIIEIKALENGAHRNQSGTFNSVPDGWAVIPDNMAIPETFPFVDVEVKNGVVKKMTAGVVPEIQEMPVDTTPTAQDDTDAMLIEHEYRITMLELGVNE